MLKARIFLIIKSEFVLSDDNINLFQKAPIYDDKNRLLFDPKDPFGLLEQAF